MIHLTELQIAISMAVKAHAGQYDKAGYPYILHPIRVSEAVDGYEAKIVAVLHDTLEDTDLTYEEIKSCFGQDIADAVLAISKLEKINGKRETYREYLDRVRNNSLAKQVKLADMADNSRAYRIAHLSVEKQVRLVAKYTRGRHYLLTGEWYENKDLDRVIKAGYKK